jgi:hypothetical protein
LLFIRQTRILVDRIRRHLVLPFRSKPLTREKDEKFMPKESILTKNVSKLVLSLDQIPETKLSVPPGRSKETSVQESSS